MCAPCIAAGSVTSPAPGVSLVAPATVAIAGGEAAPRVVAAVPRDWTWLWIVLGFMLMLRKGA